MSALILSLVLLWVVPGLLLTALVWAAERGPVPWLTVAIWPLVVAVLGLCCVAALYRWLTLGNPPAPLPPVPEYVPLRHCPSQRTPLPEDLQAMVLLVRGKLQ